MQSNSNVVKMAKAKTKSSRKAQEVQTNADWQEFSKGNFKYAPFDPLSQNQVLSYESALTNSLTLAVGPAGTGKSYAGASAAIRLLSERKIEKIAITRSPLPTGTTAGFRPGDTYEKLMPYLMPLIHTFKKVLKTPSGSDGLFNYLWEKKVIEIQDLETIKGMSFDNTFLIVEEAQECDMEQLKNLLTRLSDSSYVFVNGDTKQSNGRLKENALERYLSCFRQYNTKLLAGGLDQYAVDGIMPSWAKPVSIVEFTKEDRNGRGDHVRMMLEINDMFGL